MSENYERLRQDLKICILFRLQLDESADMCDVFKLFVFIQLVFKGAVKNKR
jgi:hypothetical protein